MARVIELSGIVVGIPSYNNRSPTSVLDALASRTILSPASVEEPSVPFRVMGRLNDSADTSPTTSTLVVPVATVITVASASFLMVVQPI